jgi:hypothetical protein
MDRVYLVRNQGIERAGARKACELDLQSGPDNRGKSLRSVLDLASIHPAVAENKPASLRLLLIANR